MEPSGSGWEVLAWRIAASVELVTLKALSMDWMPTERLFTTTEYVNVSVVPPGISMLSPTVIIFGGVLAETVCVHKTRTLSILIVSASVGLVASLKTLRNLIAKLLLDASELELVE